MHFVVRRFFFCQFFFVLSFFLFSFFFFFFLIYCFFLVFFLFLFSSLEGKKQRTKKQTQKQNKTKQKKNSYDYSNSQIHQGRRREKKKTHPASFQKKINKWYFNLVFYFIPPNNLFGIHLSLPSIHLPPKKQIFWKGKEKTTEIILRKL